MSASQATLLCGRINLKHGRSPSPRIELRRDSIEVEHRPIKLKQSLIEVEHGLIELRRTLIELEHGPISYGKGQSSSIITVSLSSDAWP
ncbi:unnamed protein product [Urochloa humidicola]